MVFLKFDKSANRCVLDFYVHESLQRKGEGKRLFDYMIDAENKNPARLAYDRPSSKFIRLAMMTHDRLPEET